MRKTLTLSNQTEKSLEILRPILQKELGGNRITDGFIANYCINKVCNEILNNQEGNSY